MAEEVYKILQSRLRKQAQQDTCGDQNDCEGCKQAKQQIDDSGRRKRPSSTGEDPLSHKIIEKRRRDRMNSCLADLSHLIPSNYLKKGRGRIEKTEIVEMAIKHIKHLHDLLPSAGNSEASSSSATTSTSITADGGETKGSDWQCPQEVESFKNGFNECLAESVHFLVEKEHIPPENPLCSRLVGHLKRYLDQKGHHSGTNSGTTTSSTTAAAETMDSDYSSLRSESSATNSEVGSNVSTQSMANSAVLNSQRNYSARMHHHAASSRGTALSENMSSGSSSNLKRRSSEEVLSGKFKFKDSIRERFSHEFETQAENATATSEHFTGVSTAEHHEFYGKRKRQSRSCEQYQEDAKPSTSQQISNSGKAVPEAQPDAKEKKKSIPIFALHPKGSHYIPLSVMDDVIQPYLHLFDQGTELPLMLHPITISVNFCGPIRIASEVSRSHISQRTSQGLDNSFGIPTIKEDRET